MQGRKSHPDNKQRERMNEKHDDLVKKIREDPLILNESGILFFEREKIVKIIPEPRIGIYISDLGIQYGGNIFLFLDVKTDVGRSMSEWDDRVKKSYHQKNIEKFKKRYSLDIKDIVPDFIAVVKDPWETRVYHPYKFRIPNAEYYRKK